MRALIWLLVLLFIPLTGYTSAGSLAITNLEDGQEIEREGFTVSWNGSPNSEYFLGIKEKPSDSGFIKVIPAFGNTVSLEKQDLENLPNDFSVCVFERTRGGENASEYISLRAGVLDTTKGVQYPKYQLGPGGQGALSPNRGMWLYECLPSDVKEFTAKRDVYASWSFSGSWSYSVNSAEPFSVGMKNYYVLGKTPYYKRWRLWTKFDISNLPADAEIEDAYLYIVDMNSHSWGLEELGNPPNKYTVGLSGSIPSSWTAADSFTTIDGASPVVAKADCINPYGTPGISQIQPRTVCIYGLKSVVSAWKAGSTANNGIVLNTLSTTHEKTSVPYFTYQGSKYKESYIDNISKGSIRLVVKLDRPPTEPVMQSVLTTDISFDKIKLRWDECPDGDFESYRLYRSKESSVNNSSTMVALIRNQDQLYFEDSGLEDDTTYYYKLYVYDFKGKYTGGNVVSAKTENKPGAISLEVTSVTENEIKLKWTHAAESDFKEYKIFTSASSTVNMYSTLLATIPNADTKEYVDAGLTYNTTYYYRIYAYNTKGYYSESPVVTQTTLAPVPPTPVVLENPSEITYGSMKLKWGKSTDADFGAYILYRDVSPYFLIPDGYNYTTAVEVARFYNVDSIEVEDLTLSPETTYYYKVAVVDLTNVTSISNEVNGKTLKEPTETSVQLNPATDITKTSCKLSWTRSNDPKFSYYTVLRSYSADMSNAVAVSTFYKKDELSYSDTQLVLNTTYFYQIQIYRTDNTVRVSNIISVTTSSPDPATPVTLEQPSYENGDIGGDRIRLKWNAVSDADFYAYRIYMSLSENVSLSSQLVATISSKYINTYVVTTDANGQPLQNNTRYYFRVLTYNVAGQMKMSNEISAVTSSTGETPPAAIVLNDPTDITYGSMKLTWAKTTVENFYCYILYRGTIKNFPVSTGVEVVRITDIDILEHIDNTLTPDTEYFYKIVVMTTNLTVSLPSNEVKGKTVTEYQETPVQLNAAANITHTSCDLSWTQTQDPRFSYYMLLRSFSHDMSGASVLKTIQERETITYKETNLTMNTTYFYQIKAFRTTGESLDSNIISVTTSPPGSPQPVNLLTPEYVSGDIGSDRIRLKWQVSTKDDGSFYAYRIFKSDKPGVTTASEAVAILTSQSITTYIVTGLTNYKTYYFRVATYNMAGAVELSNEVSATTTSDGSTPPAAVILQNPTMISYASMTLTWSKSEDPNFKAYVIYRDVNPNFNIPGSGASTAVEVTRIYDAATVTYTDNTLESNKTYYFKVVVVNTKDLVSQPSNEVYGKTMIEPPPSGVQLSLKDSEKTSCTVMWTQSTDLRFSYYSVWRSYNYDMTSGSEITRIDNQTVLEFKDESCVVNTTYYYQVRVFRNNGTYTTSNIISATTDLADYPSAPVIEQPSPADIGRDRVRVSWAQVDDADFKSYYVYMSTVPNQPYSSMILKAAISSKTVTTVTITGLSSGATYYFRVACSNVVNQMEFSEEIAVTTVYPFRSDTFEPVRGELIIGE